MHSSLTHYLKKLATKSLGNPGPNAIRNLQRTVDYQVVGEAAMGKLMDVEEEEEGVVGRIQNLALQGSRILVSRSVMLMT